jgi:hypothetical protein
MRMDPRLAARVDPSDVLQEAFLDAAHLVDNYLKDRKWPLHLAARPGLETPSQIAAGSFECPVPRRRP